MIINDRVDVALTVGADGIHLGQNDMPLKDARRLVGPSMIIGISAESLEDAVEAEEEGADYIGLSPVFSTATKKDTAKPLGLDGVRSIRKAVKIPLVAIGGIGLDNAVEVIKAGADGLAVVSAIVSASCPETATRMLSQAITMTHKGEILRD
jgi:thiamine-phosphate pyrophosphorylase